MTEEQIDEILERIWVKQEEEGFCARAAIAEQADLREPPADFEELVRRNLLERGDGNVVFTESGYSRARRIIRRHRLAERMLHDILEIDHTEMESQACEFEHVLSAGVAESICTLLGHPPSCPHGKPIPPGECCKRNERTPRPLVAPLSDLPAGVEGRIVFIRSRDPAHLQRLGALGVLPGNSIHMHQKRPSLVIGVGETTVAIDEEIAREIYVKADPAVAGPERAHKAWRRWLQKGPGGRGRRMRWDGRS